MSAQTLPASDAARQIVLDTETTGLKTSEGHRVIEIGAYELIARRPTGRTLHRYLNPEREVDAGAAEVHGMTWSMLQDKPRFAEVADELIAFLDGAELVIHNADFDVGFINYELSLLRAAPGSEAVPRRIEDICGVLDTLKLARRLHAAGNSLDALCKRYGIDNSARTLHGAMLDAEILAEVYLAMTGGQTALPLSVSQEAGSADSADVALERPPQGFKVVRAREAELAAHAERLAAVDRASGGSCVWLKALGSG